MRKPRYLVPEAKYAVAAFANRQEVILGSPDMKRLLQAIIAKAKKKYRFILHGYFIMGSHIHFMIEPRGDAGLSKIMQWILSVFAVRYNAIHGYRGHVWYDRFKSRVIRHFHQCARAHADWLNKFMPVRGSRSIGKHSHKTINPLLVYGSLKLKPP